MIKEKRKVLVHRIICLMCAFVFAIISIVMFCKDYDYVNFSAGICFMFIFLLFLILAFVRNCKTYIHRGKKIIVYSGIYHHYLKVDDKIVDEENTYMYHTSIVLDYHHLDDGHIEAKISTSSSISVKINGILKYPTSFTI